MGVLKFLGLDLSRGEGVEEKAKKIIRKKGFNRGGAAVEDG